MELNEVLLAVLLIAGAILCIYLIVALKKITQSLYAIRDDLHNLIDETIPVVQNMNEISKHVMNVSNKAQEQVLDISTGIDDVKNRIKNIRNKFTNENQVILFVHNLKAIIKGINAFIKDFNK